MHASTASLYLPSAQREYIAVRLALRADHAASVSAFLINQKRLNKLVSGHAGVAGHAARPRVIRK
jgi:hypothetical protein